MLIGHYNHDQTLIHQYRYSLNTDVLDGHEECNKGGTHVDFHTIVSPLPLSLK